MSLEEEGRILDLEQRVAALEGYVDHLRVALRDMVAATSCTAPPAEVSTCHCPRCLGEHALAVTSGEIRPCTACGGTGAGRTSPGVPDTGIVYTVPCDECGGRGTT